MITHALKQRFVELRAEGQSLRKISGELQLSRPTLVKLERECAAAVKNLQALALDELVSSYSLAAQQRLTILGENLKKINLALNSKDLGLLGPVELLNLQAKNLDLLGKTLDKTPLLLTDEEESEGEPASKVIPSAADEYL